MTWHGRPTGARWGTGPEAVAGAGAGPRGL